MASESLAVEKDSASIAHSPKRKFEGHGGGISSFIFLHDNIHIISSSFDGTMRKWNSETGLHVGDPWTGEGGEIRALALSADGETIACGRMDGRLEMWNTDGDMVDSGNHDGTRHGKGIESLSWSPSESRLASGYEDGTILIRNAESGEIEVGPIETNQGSVISVTYSPSGDRIASGGSNYTISIWDSKTGGHLVSPVEDFGIRVDCVVWSSDSSKLYSASDHFARVFDSSSGKLLHCFKHDNFLNFVALSPKSNLLACVGLGGIAHLWDTESYQPLGHPFHQEDGKHLDCVSFSQDGKYLAYGGEDQMVTLWFVKDIAPRPSLASLEVNGRKTSAQAEGDEIMEDERDNMYHDDIFFQTPEKPRPFASHGDLRPSRRLRIFSAERLWNALIPSRYHKPTNESTRSQECSKRNGIGENSGRQRTTIFATRKKAMIVHAPRNTFWPSIKTKAGQSSSTTAQSPTAAVQLSTAQSQNTQSQPAARHARISNDYGCWDNFRSTACCTQLRRRRGSVVEATTKSDCQIPLQDMSSPPPNI